MVDDSATLAEFTDIMRAEESGPGILEGVASALGEVRDDLPVVDLGSGTGLGVLRLAEAYPRHRVIAVEQSQGMRAVLFSRIAYDKALRERVTVVPDDVFAADLPGTWGAAVATHFVCQISPPRRRDLWALLAARLAPGAPAVIDRHYGIKATMSAENVRTCRTVVGEHVYERWFSCTPVGDDAIAYTDTYRVLRGEVIVSEGSVAGTSWVAREDDVIAEAAGAGLTVVRETGDFLILARQG